MMKKANQTAVLAGGRNPTIAANIHRAKYPQGDSRQPHPQQHDSQRRQIVYHDLDEEKRPTPQNGQGNQHYPFTKPHRLIDCSIHVE